MLRFPVPCWNLLLAAHLFCWMQHHQSWWSKVSLKRNKSSSCETLCVLLFRPTCPPSIHPSIRPSVHRINISAHTGVQFLGGCWEMGSPQRKVCRLGNTNLLPDHRCLNTLWTIRPCCVLLWLMETFVAGSIPHCWSDQGAGAKQRNNTEDLGLKGTHCVRICTLIKGLSSFPPTTTTTAASCCSSWPHYTERDIFRQNSP